MPTSILSAKVPGFGSPGRVDGAGLSQPRDLGSRFTLGLCVYCDPSQGGVGRLHGMKRGLLQNVPGGTQLRFLGSFTNWAVLRMGELILCGWQPLLPGLRAATEAHNPLGGVIRRSSCRAASLFPSLRFWMR
jgi:hypothetical protein